MDKLIVGLVGPLGVGKTTVADFLVSKRFVKVSFSDPIRAELDRQALPQTRDNMQDLGDSWRKKHGLDHIAKLLIKTIDQSPADHFVVEGFRNPGEIVPFQKLKNFILIGLTADPQVRFDRLKYRGKESDPIDWVEFQKQEDRDQGIEQPEHGQRVTEALSLASFVIDTDKVESRVNQTVDEIIKEATNHARREITNRPEDCSFC